MRSARVAACVAALALVAAVVPYLGASAGSGVISGRITSSVTGLPVVGATVTTKPPTASATTDSWGSYQVSVPAATYSVVAKAGGYNDNTAVATNDGISTTTVNLAMVPIPPLVAEDLFTRPDQTGIGTSTDGHTWSDDSAGTTASA